MESVNSNSDLIRTNIQFIQKTSFVKEAQKTHQFCIDLMTNKLSAVPADTKDLIQNHEIIEVTVDRSEVIISQKGKLQLEPEHLDFLKQCFKGALEESSLSLKRKPFEQEGSTEIKKTKDFFQSSDIKEINDVLIKIFPKEELSSLMKTSNLGDISKNEIARVIFGQLDRLFGQRDPISEKQIHLAYQLLFHTALKDMAQEHKDKEGNSIWAVDRLFQVIKGGKQVSMGELKPDADFISEVFVLQNAKGENLWVFKPERGERIEKEGIKSGQGAKREHVAHLLNFEKTFPIPYTAYVQIKGQVGSVQLYVPASGFYEKVWELEEENEQSTKIEEKESSKLESDEEETKVKSDQEEQIEESPRIDYSQIILQSLNGSEVIDLTIFDLLFLNTDRGFNNFLISTELSPYPLYGIDNGCILTESLEDSLTIPLGTSSHLDKPLPKDKLDLISKKRLEQYNAILKEHGFGEVPCKWMQLCGQLLELGINKQDSSEGLLWGSDLVTILSHHWKDLMEVENPQELFTSLVEDVIEHKKLILKSTGEVSIGDVIEGLNEERNLVGWEDTLKSILENFHDILNQQENE